MGRQDIVDVKKKIEFLFEGFFPPNVLCFSNVSDLYCDDIALDATPV